MKTLDTQPGYGEGAFDEGSVEELPCDSVTVDSTTGAVYPATYDMYTVGAG